MPADLEQTSAMPPSSDPFDFDDDLFANPATFDALEAYALQSTQVPLAPPPQPGPAKRLNAAYQHQAARAPNRPPILSQTFAGRKEPAPLNTAPRAGNSGFGWEYGGKRSIEGNVARHIAAIDERAAYWSHGNRLEEEDDFPDVVVGEDGEYGVGRQEDGHGEVVDKHAKTGESLMWDAKGDAERGGAIEAGSREASRPTISRSTSAGPSKLPPQAHPEHQYQPQLQKTPLQSQQFIQRPLSRSASDGSRPLPRAQSRTNPLRPIASQSSQESQGSAARRAAMELDEERRKREAVEAQLQALRDQLLDDRDKVKGKERETEGEVTDEREDITKRMEELQAELWRAKGEAETMRRAQKDVSPRFIRFERGYSEADG